MRQDEQESRPESFFRQRVDEREERRDDERGCKIREERKGGEVLDRTSHFTGNDGCGSGGRHDETEHQSLGKVPILGKVIDTGVGSQTEGDLGKEDNEMPFVQSQIQRVDLAESKEEHSEDQPRKCRFQREKTAIPECSDEHAEPKGVTIKKFFDIYHFVIYHLVIYLVIGPFSDDVIHDGEDFGDGFSAEEGDAGLFEVIEALEDG